MVTGGPGVRGAHVTQKQGKKRDTDHAIIQHTKMEVPTAQGHLIHLHYVRNLTIFSFIQTIIGLARLSGKTSGDF